ncbi:MAG: hypothetical protein ACR2QT_09010 [Woeseiaceae bacterium]
MGSFRHERSGGGLDVIRLQNDVIELAIVPAAGGKILELIDRRNGRNWLWRNAHIPVSSARRGANFERELDSGGWDDVLLSVKPAVIDVGDQHGKSVPDHGDLIGNEWVVEELIVNDAGDVICTMTTTGDCTNYHYKRRIRLLHDCAQIEINYRLRNNGTDPMPGYWCAHPLLAIDADARIEIEGNMPFRVDDAETKKSCATNGDLRWPNLQLQSGDTLDLSRSFKSNGNPQPTASKIFVRAPETGAASVRLADSKSRLTFHFSPSELPWLGLWINNGAWSGCGSEPYVNLGIEPATAPYDCVNEAIENDAVPWLEPGAETCWSLSVEVQA